MRCSSGQWDTNKSLQRGFWENSKSSWVPLRVAEQKSRRSQGPYRLHWASALVLGFLPTGLVRETNMYLFQQLFGIFSPASWSITNWYKWLPVITAALAIGCLCSLWGAKRLTSASLSALLLSSIYLHMSFPNLPTIYHSRKIHKEP